MKGDPKVIAGLQAALAQEATLQLQYQADARQLKSMGLDGLASKVCGFGTDSKCFLKKLMRRLLLFRSPIGYSPDAVVDRSDITELLSGELALEMAIVNPYEQQIQVAQKAFDDTTRNLYEHLLKWHQEHVEWIEKQQAQLDKVGETDYFSEKMD
jgi:bacterioferritin